jgi:glutamyl/glutaminyl-tRNA synthetase
VSNIKWTTKAGSFKTSKKVNCTFTMPEFHEGRDINWNCYVDETDNKLSRYDMIMGRDLLKDLKMDFLFSKNLITWDNASIPMRDPDCFEKENIEDFEQEIFLMHDPDTTEVERIQQILDAKYAPANLKAECNKCKHLTKPEQQTLHNLLKKYESLFDGTLGKWKTTPIKIELKEPDAKPYHARPYPVPYSQEQKLKEEIRRLEEYGVLRKCNKSE